MQKSFSYLFWLGSSVESLQWQELRNPAVVTILFDCSEKYKNKQIQQQIFTNFLESLLIPVKKFGSKYHSLEFT